MPGYVIFGVGLESICVLDVINKEYYRLYVSKNESCWCSEF